MNKNIRHVFMKNTLDTNLRVLKKFMIKLKANQNSKKKLKINTKTKKGHKKV
jgi:hypothetical protein